VLCRSCVNPALAGLLAVLAGCSSKSASNSDSAKAATTPAAAPSKRTVEFDSAAFAKLQIANVDSVIHSSGGLSAYVQTLTLHGAHHIKVPAQMTGACNKDHVDLTFAAVSGSGSASLANYTAASNAGASVAVITNPSKKCDSDFIKIKHKHSALWIVTGTGAAATNRLLDVTDGSTIPMPVNFLACEGTHDPDGDVAVAKPAGKLKACDHIIPPDDPGDPNDDGGLDLISFRTSPTFPVDGDWTMWLSCGDQCCYADGGMGPRGRGPGDTSKGGKKVSSALPPSRVTAAHVN